MEPRVIPFIPESAPFTAPQRAYLNGLLAGLFSVANMDSIPTTGPATAPAGNGLRPLSILFGSQTGNAEALAKRTAKEAARRGFNAAIHDMAQYPITNLKSEKYVLIVTSTYGEGDPPDNAKAFWDCLNRESATDLGEMVYSVLALGDSNYPQFCQFGKQIDQRLEALGARRAHPRVDCDVEFEVPFREWLGGVWTALAEGSRAMDSSASRIDLGLTRHESDSSRVGEVETSRQVPSAQSEIRVDVSGKLYSRSNPFPARLVTNRKLNGERSAKETRHFEISLAGSDLTYQAGDALGVIPSNCPEAVDEILKRLGFSGDEKVPSSDDKTVLPICDALLKEYEITRISSSFLKALADKTADATLRRLTSPDVNGELNQFLWGREIVDLLADFPQAHFAPDEFVGALRRLQPRLYSISSSPSQHAGQAHLTVAVVRYESLGRVRRGVCSCFLADRVSVGSTVPVFVHENKKFRLPTDPARPIIAVGPGTGIAPFRAFLYERQAARASGKTWLFFGDQHASTDFLYRDELELLMRDGALSRLDTAFSRDQAEKIYVQHRMLENARDLFDWLENGAHFYVCGDAKRMARDVENALLEAIQAGGGRTENQAAEYLARLKSEARYQRDVY